MKLSTFHIQIKEGKIAFKSDAHKAMFERYLTQFEGKDVFMEINEKKVTRSGQQNNYLWLYMNIISQETGYTPNEAHEYFKGKYLTEGIKEVFGAKVRIKKSTTELTKGEFSNYLADIFVETGIPLPDTTEYLGYSYHK